MKRILLPLLILSIFAASMSAQRGNNIDARKLQLALYAISNLYVDSTSETKLVEDAIVGMLEKLDPHSTYTDPEETKEMTEPLQGNFDGIGIQFNMLTDTLYVIQVIPGQIPVSYRQDSAWRSQKKVWYGCWARKIRLPVFFRLHNEHMPRNLLRSGPPGLRSPVSPLPTGPVNQSNVA